MGEIVYFVDDGNIVITCPRCRFSREISTASFLAHPNHVKLRVKCRCGWVHRGYLERRRQHRKFTKLAGRYIYLSDKFIHTEGSISIKDLSSSGIGFTLLKTPRVTPLPGDLLSVQFKINELPGAFFNKEVLVKSSKGSRVGARFLKRIRYETDKTLKIFLSS